MVTVSPETPEIPAHIESQHDVVLTSFMLRVREFLEGADGGQVGVRASLLKPVAEATDEWFYLRCRSEQMVAEANSVLPAGAAHLEIEDEYGTGRLAFVMRCREQSSRISLGQASRQAWVELERSYRPDAGPVEPEGPETVEDLIIELMVERPGR